MNDHAVLTAETAEHLISANKLHLLPQLYASVSMPPEAQLALLDNPNTAAAARNLPAGIIVRSAERLDNETEATFANGHISRDEAEASALAKEFTANGVDCAVVLTENPAVEHHLYDGKQEIRVFAADFWSTMCQAHEKQLVDLERERPQLEKIAPMREETKQRVDLFQTYQREQELKQARENGQVH